MKIKVAVFGPHDRFNFGDFLFPFMLEYAFERLSPKTFEIERFSLVNAEFTNSGAYKSKSYRKLIKGINSKKYKVLIVAGGECLGVKWHSLFYFINSFYFKLSQRNWIKRQLIRHNIAKLLLGGKTEYPYCVNKLDFNKYFLLLFNSVGGIFGFNDLQQKALNKADYIALRDNTSFKHSEVLNNKAYLVPDSAIILSDVFSLSSLMQSKFLKNIAIIDLLNSGKRYLFFQISKYFVRNKLDEIVEQLEKISIQHGLTIVLCPIGLAFGHEDLFALRSIKEKLNNKDTILIQSPTIQEIMVLIGNSYMQIGTSLHGIITAMSYGVPYIGLNKNPIKIATYLETWSIEELNQTLDVDNFAFQTNFIAENYSNLKHKIIENTIHQKALYYNSVSKMLGIIKSNEF